MLDKMGGVWAPRPSTGPHKLRECLPLVLILRNRLKYALTNKEVQTILMQRLVKVDGKVRTDVNYPVGFMDVISLEKSDEHFRLMYDAKGRFVLHRLNNKNHDVAKVDLATGKAVDCLKFEVGSQCIVTKGQNQGRMGTVTHREKHVGSFEIV